MNRRDLLKTAGLATSMAIVTPKVLAHPMLTDSNSEEKWAGFADERSYLENIGWNPDQIAAWMRMRKFEKRVRSIYRDVASEFPQKIPDGTDKTIWRHGDYRITGRVGHRSDADCSYPGAPYPTTRLSDITCFCFWRQAVRNKHTEELKFFASWGTIDTDTKSVIPGQSVTVHDDLKISMSDNEIAQFARKSFLKLQEMCEEFYNREAA